jgi:hypothetical protein
MKKITTALFAFLIGNAVANADSTNIGLKISYGTMDASGSHTTNSGSISSGGTAVNASGDASFPFGSVFVERQISTGNMDIALGLDINPTTQEVDKLGGGDGFDATVDMGNLYTAYIQPMKKSGNITFFAKLGYSQADIDISNISRQATTAGTASTDGPQSKSLEGPMFGLGIQVDTASSSFVRLEASRTDFDEISHTNSNGKIVKADAELDAISISFGKSF